MAKNQETPVFQESALPAHLLTRPAGAADASQTLRLALRLFPQGGDEAIFARVAQMGALHPTERQAMTMEALASEFGPAPEALDAVQAFCDQHGFTLDHTSLGGLFATVVGNAGDLARAFGVGLQMYHYEDRMFRGYEGTLTMPAALAPHVAAVLGLDNVSSVISRITKAKQPPCWVRTDSNGHNSPLTVADTYYQYPTSYTGTGATIALIEQNLFIDLDNVEAWFSFLNYDVNLQLVRGSGYGAGSSADRQTDTSDLNGEAMLDIKLAGAVAPGATLAVYGMDQGYGHSSSGWIDTLIAAMNTSEYPCNVMSISLGGPEHGWQVQEALCVHFMFGLAALLNITVCVSSGDYGARGNRSGMLVQNCAFPASSPLCLACGGTELLVSQDLTLQGEVVWNELGGNLVDDINQKCATGGGRSVLFQVPEFQQGLSLPDGFNPGLPAGRALPDVAANAAIASGYGLDPEDLSDYFGTSAAAPMWAALIARLIEGCGGKALGYLNQWLYAGQIDEKLSFCTPITQGNNGVPGDTVVYYAEPGNVWNACCGMGSPLGVNIAKGLGIDVSRAASAGRQNAGDKTPKARD
jgi:kumamolisin